MPDARRTETPARLAFMLTGRAISRPYSERAMALADLEEALTMVRAVDDPLTLGYVLSQYGLLLGIDGGTRRAEAMHGEVLAIARTLDDVNLRAEAHYALGMDGACGGDLASVEPHLALATNHYTDIDLLDGVTRCLGTFAILALKTGNAPLAARLIGANSAAREIVDLTPWPTAAEAERRATEDTRKRLPDGEFAVQVAAGRAMTIRQTLAEATRELDGGETSIMW